MSVGTLDRVATKKEKVETKEELEDLRARLADLRQGQSKTPSQDPSGKRPSWSDDVDDLAAFLEHLKAAMKFLIDDRVPEKPRKLFSDCLPIIDVRIDIAIEELRQIDSEDHVMYVKLFNAGLTGKPRELKVREYKRRIGHSPVSAVLEMADRILSSIFPILNVLEPVKEFKETLEGRLKNDGDAGLQSLNISGREKWWEDAE